MDAAVISILVALIAGSFGIAGGYLAGQRQANLEDRKWVRAREDDALKELHLAVADLTRKLAAATHSMQWLTWKAALQPAQFSEENIASYNSEMHLLLPEIMGSHMLVAALDQEMYRKMNPLVHRVFALDDFIARAAASFKPTDPSSLADLANYMDRTQGFYNGLSQTVVDILSGSVRTERT